MGIYQEHMERAFYRCNIVGVVASEGLRRAATAAAMVVGIYRWCCVCFENENIWREVLPPRNGYCIVRHPII